MSFREEWKVIKEAWLGKRSPLPAAVIKNISGKGFDLGPSLDKFEKAAGFQEQQQAMAALTKAHDGYLTVIKAELAAAKAMPEVVSGLTTFLKAFTALWKKIEAKAQPPVPSGRAKELELVYARNLASGLRPKWLELGSIEVRAWLVVDEEYQKLVERGWAEDAHIQIMKAVQKEVEIHTKAFRDTIKDIDAKMNGYSAEERAAKIKEANEVLKHYKNIVERRINEIVDKIWAERVERKAHLKAFKSSCRIKIAASAVTIAVGSASVALTFGVAALNLIAVAKATYDLAVTIDKLSRGVEAAEKDLITHMKNITELVEKRRRAAEQQTGQKLEKIKEVGKELAKTILGEAHKKFFKTTSGAAAVATEYNGKLRELEKKRAEMYKQIVQFTNNFPSDPGQQPLTNILKKTHAHFMTLNQKYSQFDAGVDKRIEFSKACMALVKEAQDFDNAAVWANRIAAIVALVAGVYGIANLATFASTSKDLLAQASELA